MAEINELAEQLGKAIAQSAQAANLHTARTAVSGQADLTQLLKDYQVQSEKIARLEHEHKPVEVDDKRKLQELHSKLIASEVFKKFTAAQVEYIDLLRRVNETIRKNLAEIEAD